MKCIILHTFTYKVNFYFKNKIICRIISKYIKMHTKKNCLIALVSRKLHQIQSKLCEIYT